MKFEEVNQLSNKFKRKSWNTNQYVFRDDLNDEFTVYYPYAQPSKNLILLPSHILADDWEVYSEDNWSLISQGESHPLAGCRFDGETIKELKKKILEDLERYREGTFNYGMVANILNRRFGF